MREQGVAGGVRGCIIQSIPCSTRTSSSALLIQWNNEEMIYQPTVTLPPRGYGMRDVLIQVMRVRMNTWRENLYQVSQLLWPPLLTTGDGHSGSDWTEHISSSPPPMGLRWCGEWRTKFLSASTPPTIELCWCVGQS